MPNLQIKDINSKNISKNVLYKVPESMRIQFVESHEDKCERVFLDYQLEDEQFGIYATEYRAPVIKKESKLRILLPVLLMKSKRTYIHWLLM